MIAAGPATDIGPIRPCNQTLGNAGGLRCTGEGHAVGGGHTYASTSGDVAGQRSGD